MTRRAGWRWMACAGCGRSCIMHARGGTCANCGGDWERADVRTDERGRRRVPVHPDEDLDGERDTGPVDPWVEALR